MTEVDFKFGMDRIIQVYGDKFYPAERVQTLWRELRGLSADQFNKICNELIGSHRNAPMLNDFREAAIKAREIKHAQEKEELSWSFRSIFQREDISEMMRLLKMKMDNKISKEEFDNYIQILQRTIDEAQNGKTRI